MKTLVLGLGNLLLADEGVGVHVAQALQQRGFDETVSVIDAGTAVLDALPQIEAAERIIVVDACMGDAKPGTVYCLKVDECDDKPFIGSVHGFDLKYVMALASRTSLPEVTVIGVQPERITWSMELSPSVAAVVPGVIEIVEKMITTKKEVEACR